MSRESHAAVERAKRIAAKTIVRTENRKAHSLHRLVGPPLTIKLALEKLAWSIGRDDAYNGLPPFARSRNYRPIHRRRYREGYAAQLRANTKRSDGCEKGKANEQE